MEDFNIITGVVIPYTNLAIFLILGNKFLKKPIVNAIAARKTDYVKLLEVANQSKAEAEAKHKELSDRLAQLDSEMESIKTNIVDQANKEADKLIEDAKRLASHIKTEASRIASSEVELARKEIQDEIIESVHSEVVNQVTSRVTEASHDSIFEKQLQLVKNIGEES
ncbi:MAG: ATP synthase F0 subunit B [Pseudobacteriovorax sp.]|nr:ATP synthase F0 subunit B [Pseudobacteriovorax sp.]